MCALPIYFSFVSFFFFFFFKQKTAYEILASDWSSDVCSSDLFSADAGSMAWYRTWRLHLASDKRAQQLLLHELDDGDRKSVV